MNLQRLSIRQTFASIGIETRSGQHNIQSPPGELTVETAPAALDVQKRSGELVVDSSKAWMALGKGNHLEWMQMISSQMEQQYLVNVSRIVEEGNRLAQFTKRGNTIADIMAQRIQEKTIVEYNGAASSDHVRVRYNPTVLDMNWTPHQTVVNYNPKRPDISFSPAKVEIYLKNKNNLDIWVSNYDIFA
ncbi:DUF6470 family protein [Paenibacillus lautus]|uniref:DUF6470 family protein n=1 Tax=Paenibacillus TaxID=44249 RepID=UPI00240DF83D|nr:DUF6470 family protein [Paenibacillus sp. BR1-192]MBY0163237.1 hypothetical protein [Cytobacillus firmus]WFB58173.1 DUF6470 family protein [Paenibacillus sp. BR1-192]